MLDHSEIYSALNSISDRAERVLKRRYPELARLLAVWRGQTDSSSPATAIAALELLRMQIKEVLGRLREDRLLPSDVIALTHVELDGTPQTIEQQLAGGSIHEPDYHVFSRLDRSLGTILDIGANWGFSVASIRATGCDCPILSFEVLLGFMSSLERLKDLLGKDYDYLMVGVGDAAATLTFRTPVINRQALTCLTSARTEEASAIVIDHLVKYAQDYLKDASSYDFQLLIQDASIDTLDHLLERKGLAVPVDRIAAIKLDVEGLEGAVLAGARKTLQRDKPLLMAECGNRAEDVRAVTEALGYRLAEAVPGDWQLRPVEGYTQGANGFFFHPEHEQMYRQRGLLLPH